MEIKLKAIHKNKWAGINRFPSCTDALGPYLTRSGSVYTGLTRDDEKRLGEILGYDLRKSSSFWNDFRIRIGQEDIVLDLEDPADELKYIFLKNHKRVKKSIHEFNAGADYYLSNPEEEATTFNEVNRMKRRAVKEFDKMKPADIRKALRLYGYNAKGMSDSVCEDRLYTLVENNPKHFFTKWVENKHRATEFLVKEAQAKDVVKKANNTYSFGSITLGHSLEDAISFIDNGENSDIKAEIINATTN